MDWATGGKMVTQVASAWGNYQTSKIQYDMEQFAKKHRDSMNAIARAQQENSLTLQEVNVRDAGMRAAQALALQSNAETADAEVSAAAAGVAGGSVQATMRGLERSALKANANRKATIQSKLKAIGQERKNLKLDAIFGRDIGTSLRPSASMALLGLGTQLIQTYDENQPEGYKTTDVLSSRITDWFGKDI